MRTYLALSAAVGLIQIVDAGLLYADAGIPSGPSVIFFVIELLWALVSLIVLIIVKHRVSRILALCFLLYNVAGWLVGSFLVPPSDAIPMWAVLAGGLFGLFYAGSSAYAANRP